MKEQSLLAKRTSSCLSLRGCAAGVHTDTQQTAVGVPERAETLEPVRPAAACGVWTGTRARNAGEPTASQAAAGHARGGGSAGG